MKWVCFISEILLVGGKSFPLTLDFDFDTRLSRIHSSLL